jgi:hypothetical protein
MSLGAHEGQSVEDLAVGDGLATQAPQIVVRTLDLVPIEGFVDHRQVDPRGSVVHAHLADEPRPMLLRAQVDNQSISDSLGIIDQTKS